MLQKIIRATITLGVVFAALLPALPAAAATNVYGELCKTPGAGGSAACTAGNTDPISGSGGLLYKATQIIATITGIVAVFMVIFGGFRYITSAGDSHKITSAKNTIIYALVGLVVIVLARSIIVLVINKL